MAVNDSSHDPRRWSYRKLLAELQRKANMKTMAVDFTRDQLDQLRNSGPMDWGTHSNCIREATRLYRTSWIDPLIAELERRLIKPKKPKASES